ncbi:MAG: Rieske 2Fe-2S domain-containing protein [Rhodospirillales bacterium]
MKRIPICKVSEVPVNGIRQFESGGKSICVINGGKHFFACQSKCPHEGIALCEGVFDGELLTCVEHLWQWSLADGGEPRGLAEGPLEMYPVTVDAGVVFLDG